MGQGRHVLRDWGFALAGALVWCLIGMLCVYAMFLIALSSIALAVLVGTRTAYSMHDCSSMRPSDYLPPGLRNSPTMH